MFQPEAWTSLHFVLLPGKQAKEPTPPPEQNPQPPPWAHDRSFQNKSGGRRFTPQFPWGREEAWEPLTGGGVCSAGPNAGLPWGDRLLLSGGFHPPRCFARRVLRVWKHSSTSSGVVDRARSASRQDLGRPGRSVPVGAFRAAERVLGHRLGCIWPPAGSAGRLGPPTSCGGCTLLGGTWHSAWTAVQPVPASGSCPQGHESL